MSSAPSGSSVPASIGPDEVMGPLDADRLCPRCLHQLSGTPVYRDRRLDMLHVRCPECGTHSPVTEHPHVGRWMRRFLALFAAMLALVLFALFAADVAGSTACIYLTEEEATRAYEPGLSSAGAELASSTGPQQGNWWAPPELLDRPDLIQAVGASPEHRNAARQFFLWALVPGAFVMAASSLLWTIVLSHRQLRKAWVWLALIQAVALGFALLVWSSEWSSRSQISYYALAERDFGLPYLLAGAAVLLFYRVSLFFLFRPIVRSVSRLILPPKLARGMTAIWYDEPVAGTPSQR